VLDAATGTLVASFDAGSGRAFEAAFAPDGRRLVSADEGPAVPIFDLATGRGILAFPAAGPTGTWDACFSPDGARIATCGAAETVRVYDAARLDLARAFPGHPSSVSAVAFDAGGRLLVTAAKDGLVRVFDVATGETVALLRGDVAEPGAVRAVFLGPDGRRVASLGTRRVRAFELPEGRPAFAIELPAQGLDLAASPDGRRLAAPTRYGTILVLDVEAVDRFLSAPVERIREEVEADTGLRFDGREVVPVPTNRLVPAAENDAR
jgi:DNA-binding beta-propeller fold protein YncE